MPPERNSVRPASSRLSAKGAAEHLLVAGGLCRLGRWWWRDRVVVLAYHNIVPDGEPPVGDASLHLPRRQFADQLDRLVETHDVVGLDDLDGGDTDRRRPRAVITFDDAYRGALEHGLPELTRRGMSATVFVAPGLLGGQVFWWDLLASPETLEVPAATREAALTVHAGRHQAVLEHFRPESGRIERIPPYCRSATEGELRDAIDRHDLLVGSHTWSHPNLKELSDEDIARELGECQRWLTDHLSSGVLWLAYPYGLSSDRVERVAQSVVDGALSLRAGFAPHPLTGAVRYRVPRINVPAGVSLRGFELRVSGIMRR